MKSFYIKHKGHERENFSIKRIVFIELHILNLLHLWILQEILLKEKFVCSLFSFNFCENKVGKMFWFRIFLEQRYDFRDIFCLQTSKIMIFK
jgi:hypothetical protein